MKNFIAIYLATLGFAGAAVAQTATANLDIGNFEAPIRSDGQLFQNSTYTLGGLEWPKVANVADQRYISYTGQIWMGGHDQQNTLRVAANTYAQQGGEGYHPGLAGFDPNLYDQVWKITRAEVDQFRLAFANGTVNFANYPVIQNWPAFGTTTLGAVKAYAPFVDVDGNPAAYTPSAGDYPDIPGDQALFFGFTDDPGSGTPRFADYLGLDVVAFAYGYDCPTLQDVLFLQYDVINATARSYTDFQVGMWHDADLGNPFDDYFGSDTTSAHPLAYFYNGDAYDETSAGYGLHPPAVGVTLLSGAASSMIYYNNDFSIQGNPSTAANHYGYLNATWIDGRHLTYGGSGYDTASTTTTNFAFTGDAGFCGGTVTGWSNYSEGIAPTDVRTVLASEEQALDAGETKRFLFSFLMARDTVNDNLGSTCKLLTLQDSLSSWMVNSDMPCASLSTGVTPQHRTVSAVLFPNPSAMASTLRFDNASGRMAQVQVYDLQGRAVGAPQKGIVQEFEIDLDGLAQGLYLVKLTCGDAQTTLRLEKL